MGLKSPTVTNAQNTQAPMAKHVVTVGSRVVTKTTTATTNAQNAQAPVAKHVVTVGHAWSQTSQRRSPMRKTPSPQWQNALWPGVTHGHKRHNFDHTCAKRPTHALAAARL